MRCCDVRAGAQRASVSSASVALPRDSGLRGWGNTGEIVLFEISTSMKPYPYVFHAYVSKSRPVIGPFGPLNLDEASDRIPPTSYGSWPGCSWLLLAAAGPMLTLLV